MEAVQNQLISQPISVFQGVLLPEENMTLAGYAALIARYDLRVPLPDRMAAISLRHRKYATERWAIFTPRHKPDDSLFAHLTFALKYEGVDLAVLSALFGSVEAGEIASLIRAELTGQYSRRIWFFFEWITGTTLDIPDAKAGDYVDALDGSLQFPGPSKMSKRHRVRNNLPGVRDFCPLVRRTEKLEHFIAQDLSEKAKEVLGAIHPDLVARAAAFLLIKDSKASYAIEGERPPHSRAERWGQAIGQAGRQQLRPEEFLRLQNIVIEDTRFITMGWRKEGGFIGLHDGSANPIPDHISARWQDIERLIDGLVATDRELAGSVYDPVLAATSIAFGFVFIHPLVDGNGRIHRYLIHHVLAEKGFTPKGFVFPVSAAILKRIDEYRAALEAYSKPRLPLIEWKPTDRGNVEVLNDTLDLYRFSDATKQAEFLYECVRQTIEEILPEEVRYLARHDRMKAWIVERFEMTDRQIELLINFLRQGTGKLSKRALEKEFAALKPGEAALLEETFQKIFSE